MSDIIIMDGRSKFGTYRVSTPRGSVHLDFDAAPKHVRISVCEYGKSWVSRLVHREWMERVWAIIPNKPSSPPQP